MLSRFAREVLTEWAVVVLKRERTLLQKMQLGRPPQRRQPETEDASMAQRGVHRASIRGDANRHANEPSMADETLEALAHIDKLLARASLELLDLAHKPRASGD